VPKTDDLVIEKKKTTSKKLKPPSKFKVVVCNDNVTTVDFVVHMLMTVFNHSLEQAIQITQAVHENGSGIAGIYPHEIAEQKVYEGVELARTNKFPLVLKLTEA